MKLIVLFLFVGLMNQTGRACQFDPPGMSHQQWVQWVDERNKKNDEMTQKTSEAKLTRLEDPKAKIKPGQDRRQYREVRRTMAGENAVIRIRER